MRKSRSFTKDKQHRNPFVYEVFEFVRATFSRTLITT